MNRLSEIVRRQSLFFLLCCCWWLAAGGLVLRFSRDQLFFAVNGYHNHFLDRVMPLTTYMGNGWAFVLLLLLILAFRKYRLFLKGALIFGFSSLLAQLLKHLCHAPRPLAYYHGHDNLLHMVTGVRVYSWFSFPSGHTTTAFALFCFLALQIRQKGWAVLFFMLALVTAWSRIYLAEHFFADVYAGSLAGVFSTLVVTLFTTRYIPDKL